MSKVPKVKGIPSTGRDEVITGSKIYVDSGHTNTADGNSGTDPEHPLATLDAAIAKCTANNGDVIYVSPGHAETLSGAADLNLDVAGISIIGLGTGASRPTITCGGTTATTVAVGAADVYLENLLFVVGVDSLTIMIDVNADDCWINKCELREGSALQALTYVDVNGGGANAADRFKFTNNIVQSVAAGSTQAVEIGAVEAGIQITDNWIKGDFSVAAIHSGSILTDSNISRNYIHNVNAGDWCIEFSDAATGFCNDNRFYANAIATVLDPGSMMCNGNLASIAVDQGGIDIPTAVSSNPAWVGALTNTGGTTTLTGILGDVANVTVATNLAKIGTIANTGGTATIGGVLGDPSNVSFATNLAKVGTIANTGGTATIGAILGDPSNVSFATKLGAIANTGGTASIGAILGDPSNVSFATKLGAFTNTGGTASIGAILGDVANVSVATSLTLVTSLLRDLLGSAIGIQDIGTIYFVDGGSSGPANDTGNGTARATPKKLLQSAIDLTTTGNNDVIIVLNYGSAGRALEAWPIELNKDMVHIVGVGNASNAWAAVCPASGTAQHAFEVTGSRCTISNLCIAGGNGKAGIHVSSGGAPWGLLVRQCIFGVDNASATTQEAILIDSGGDAPYLTILDCYFTGTVVGAGLTGDAIKIAGNATRGRIGKPGQGNFFQGLASGKIGINVTGGAVGIAIEGNRFALEEDTAGMAITLGGSSAGCWVDGNHANENVDEITANPFTDSSSGRNCWCLNYKGITAVMPA